MSCVAELVEAEHLSGSARGVRTISLLMLWGAKLLPASICTDTQRGADSKRLSPFFTSSDGKPDALTPGRDGEITFPEPAQGLMCQQNILP